MDLNIEEVEPQIDDDSVLLADDVTNDMHHFQNSELPLQSFPIFEELRQRSKLCDVVLKVHFYEKTILL